ncbi:hypothetical protein M407DRAFT_99852 [Tulasnella calospora MUT 4182]|uniref:Uncharacterized protein n=1 Tax=Tulasnella calospora MUT 4182 TaxID=1051891 RepID=A0A0C3QEU6_9AGAM|nr:hypothetical protein M407DRAFT_99852 [Tulasnella calospora MUT 4182]
MPKQVILYRYSVHVKRGRHLMNNGRVPLIRAFLLMVESPKFSNRSTISLPCRKVDLKIIKYVPGRRNASLLNTKHNSP